MAENDTLKNNPNYLLDVCKGLEELRRGNKNDIKQSQIEAFLGANQVVSNINKYFFTVATLLIPIIFSLVTIDEIRRKLNQGDSVLVVLSIIFLFLSLIAGFIHMLVEYKFFRKWLKEEDRKLKLWSSTSFWPSVPLPDKIKDYINEYDSTKSKTDDISSEMEQESQTIYLIAQGTFWFIGVVSIICIIFRQLP